MEAKNYYEILQDEDASQDEIERLYKRFVKQYHPDRGGDEEDMKAINEAYQVLGNSFTRHAYDSRRKRSYSTVIQVVPCALHGLFCGTRGTSRTGGTVQ